MSRPRLLLVPSFTELEWGIRPRVEEWAEVATFDMPGVGDESTPGALGFDPNRTGELLVRWRQAALERGLREADRHGWDRFFVVTDAHGAPTAIDVAAGSDGAVQGLAFGHAALSRSTEGERPAERAAIWEALEQLAGQGSEAFVRYGIAQATRGGWDEETAREMVERFPDTDFVTAMIRALRLNPEPVGERLASLRLPLLLAKHDGCLGATDEGFEDIVDAFPEADTVICPEACSSSPAFAQAIRSFCERVASP